MEMNDFDLTNLVYEYGNLETDLDHMKTKNEESWKWVLRLINQQWYYSRLPSIIIGRYVFIFEKLIENNRKLSHKINVALGLELFDILKIGTCISSQFISGRTVSFEIGQYTETEIDSLKSLLTEANINKFLDIFAISQDGFDWQAKVFEVQDVLLKKYEFNLLKRFPIIKTNSPIDNERFIVPSLADFMYACFEGLYYVIEERLIQPCDKDSLQEELGRIFEVYDGDLIKFYNDDLFQKIL
jgi:hypothetical protein